MHYDFGPGLIREPSEYPGGLTPAPGLSDRDKEQALRFYPPLDNGGPDPLTPFRSVPLSLAPAEQANFAVTPEATREYRIESFGASDVTLVSFEDQDGDLRFVAGDDDSGTDRNASLRVRLDKGRTYVLRVRMTLNFAAGETAVMLW